MAEPFKDSKSGNYFVSFSYGGRRHKRSTGGSDLSRARRRQRIIDGRVEQLKAGLIQVPDGVSVAEFVFDGKTEVDEETQGDSLLRFVEGYLENARPPSKAASTYTTEQIHIGHLREFLQTEGARELSELTPALFDRYKRWRHEAGVRNVTINKELGTFRTVLNSAVRSGLIQTNPLSEVKWLKEDSTFERFRTGEEINQLLASGDYPEEEAARIRRFRYLTPKEITQLLEMASSSELHVLLAVAAYTGMRLSEILRLRWSDVDFASGRILARGHKGSTQARETPRYIPLHDRLRGILVAHRKESAGALVLSDGEGTPPDRDHCYHLLRRLTDATPFEGIRFHSLRHSFASNLAAQGVDQRVIDRFMGHQTEAMQRRYQHLFPNKQKEAIHALTF